MSHNLGPIVPDGRTFDEAAGLDLIPTPGLLGGPHFVILHFTSVNLTGSARLTVNLGYDTDVFNSSSRSDFWSRPVDTFTSPILIRITGGRGSAQLLEYGSGEPTITGTPGELCGSQTNPDVFLHSAVYEEPGYETRLQCTPGFAWSNAACTLPSISTIVKDRVAAATGIIVEIHDGHVSSCSGTLIGADLFLTSRHCLRDSSREDLRSASVTFDYATTCGGASPPGHVTKFFKVLDEVVSGSPPTGSKPPPSTDWVVVRLDAAPGALPDPLELRDTLLMSGEVIFTMHHPNGAAKKAQSGVHSGGTSITGFDYAGGSSGSALFDASGRLVRGPLSQGGFCDIPAQCSVTYAPIAPIKAALANPPAPAIPLDVMVVFDRSGSMGQVAPPIGRTKLDEAQDAAALFVQLVREGQGDRLGLVTFSSMADFVRPPGLAATAKPLLVGPSPFTTGDIGAISASGSTSIGAGVGNALLAFGSGSSNDRAILLLSDGLQNTAPLIEEIEGSLGSTQLCVVGFGSDAEINGPLLSRIAREHGGDFTRALDGLSLRKFFGLCFGNIFESGALDDPEFVLRPDQAASEPHKFEVCDEEYITVVIGWDEPDTALRAHIRTPSGVLINDKRLEVVRGRTWAFWRVPLPFGEEREGTWQVTVDRVLTGGDDVQPARRAARYFFLIIADGGPKLVHLGGPRRVYTGDPINPLVGLHYPNGTSPEANVTLTIEAPAVALGHLVVEHGLRPPASAADATNAFYATLQDIARQSGDVLTVPTSTITVPLFDDGTHNDGAMEPDGIYNHCLENLTRVEGTYQFRAVAKYGKYCASTRETQWAVHVEPGIDPDRSVTSMVDVVEMPDGRHGTLVITPRDRYDNPLGPGRGDSFTVMPLPGVVLNGNVRDRGDGSYGVNIVWDVSVSAIPGVLVSQPDRDPIVIRPGSEDFPHLNCNCVDVAGNLLGCLGITDPDVAGVRIKSVSLEIDLSDTHCGKEPRC
ncbi:MAG: trypsin-like peptidase domain-containing protein [Anaerolineales bacterium]